MRLASGGCFALLLITVSGADRPPTVVRETAAWDTGGQWQQTGKLEGGPMAAVEVDPATGEVYAASGSDVYRSTDRGATWQALTGSASLRDNMARLLLLAGSPPTLLAGGPRGLYRSSDGGATWTTLTSIPATVSLGGCRSDPLRVIAGTSEGKVLLSSDGGASFSVASALPADSAVAAVAISSDGRVWAGTTGLSSGSLYTSTDSGASWSEVSAGQPNGAVVRSIYVDPADERTVYVGFGRPQYGAGIDPAAQFLFSTADNGTTWQPVVLAPPVPQKGGIVLGRSSTCLYISASSQVFRSDTPGVWTKLPVGNVVDPNDLAFDPTDSLRLYLPARVGMLVSTDGGNSWTASRSGLGSSSSFLLAAAPGVVWAGSYRTTDRGASWTATEDNGIDHPFYDDIGIDPTDPRHVWIVADVGTVFETRDAGNTYAKLLTPPQGDGFRYSSIYALASAPSDPNVLYAAKNGFGIFRSTDRGASWRFLQLTEVDYTYSIAVDPTTPDVVYSGYTRKPFQTSAMVRQSSDRGESWRTALEVKDAVAVTSVAVDPSAESTVYAGSTGAEGALWVSRDSGTSWGRLADGFDFTNVHTLSASASEPAVAYAGVWGGGTWRTVDRGQTWSKLAAPTQSAVAILVHPADPQVLFLADRTAPRIWRSEDRGVTWTEHFDAGSDFYRISSAALAPSDPDVIYASVFGRSGPASGTVFRIRDGVATETPGQPGLPCVALAVDPRDEDTVYAVLHGSGVSKSRDGGATWQSLSGVGSGLPTSAAFGFNGITVDASSPDTVYLFGGCDVAFDLSHSSADPAVMHAIYRSINGGTSWTQVGSGSFGSSTGAVKGVAYVPGRPGMLLAGTLAGLRVSSDSGTSWANPAGGVAVVQAAGVAASSDGATLYLPTLGGGVLAAAIASDGAIAWDGPSTLHAPIHNVQVLVHPTDSNTVYATAYPGGVFKSTNGGASWSEQNFGMASFSIDDPARQGYYALAIAPSNPQRLYLGLYGVGVYTSQDGSATWRPVCGSTAEMFGMPITSLVVDPSDENTVWVASENGVRMTTDGGASWSDAGSGLSCPDLRVLARAADGRLYAGSKGYEVFALDAGSTSWQQLPPFGNFGVYWPIWDDRPLYQFTFVLFHPTNPRIIYLGTFPAGIFRSDDGGATWREHNVGWTNDGLFSLAFRPGDPNVLYAGTYNGVNRSTDGGEHWEVWHTGWPAEQWVYSIDFDPRNPDVMYACSKNGENEGRGREGFKGTVMKSTDAGATWSAITNGLDLTQSFYEIIVDPHYPNRVYLGTERSGVLVSRDRGESWSAFNEGLTSLVAMTNGNFVTSPMVLSADGRSLYFATGAGIFRRDLPRILRRHLGRN